MQFQGPGDGRPWTVGSALWSSRWRRTRQGWCQCKVGSGVFLRVSKGGGVGFWLTRHLVLMVCTRGGDAQGHSIESGGEQRGQGGVVVHNREEVGFTVGWGWLGSVFYFFLQWLRYWLGFGWVLQKRRGVSRMEDVWGVTRQIDLVGRPCEAVARDPEGLRNCWCVAKKGTRFFWRGGGSGCYDTARLGGRVVVGGSCEAGNLFSKKRILLSTFSGSVAKSGGFWRGGRGEGGWCLRKTESTAWRGGMSREAGRGCAGCSDLRLGRTTKKRGLWRGGGFYEIQLDLVDAT